MQKVILASQSPRRKHLLESADIQFQVIVSATDETFPAHLPTNEIPIFIAKEKAEAVFKQLSVHEKNNIIIAADTVVVLNNTIIGKPSSRENAIEILQSLSGKMHKVITGVVLKNNITEITFSETTSVYFNELKLSEIIYYVDKFTPYDKAGAYAIQEWIGMIGIYKIEGDFYNVMGLPINRLVKELKSLQVI